MRKVFIILGKDKFFIGSGRRTHVLAYGFIEDLQ